MKNPIYVPSGRAKEYGDYALNIYTGCPHRCVYCYAPAVMRKSREEFAAVTPRVGVVDAVIRQLDQSGMTGKTIHLCFACDPYPRGVNTETTRRVITAIKARGNHVQILTKGGMECARDFDLLDGGDRFGITYTGMDDMEPGAAPNFERIAVLAVARSRLIQTWISCEPIVNPAAVARIIANVRADEYKLGKLNHSADEKRYDWKSIGNKLEELCLLHGRNFVIKNDLRKEMEKEANHGNNPPL